MERGEWRNISATKLDIRLLGMMLQAGFDIRDASYSDDGFFAKYLLAVR